MIFNNMETREMFEGLKSFNISNNEKEFANASQLIHTALRLLASCAYGMHASGDMSKKASVNMATDALALANEYVADLDFSAPADALYRNLQKVEHWFNDYKCPKCGYDKDQRMDKIS
jgi:hypothetical protein